MPDLSEVHADMADAEGKVRSALNAATPAARCRALMDAYWQTPEAARDAFVLALAGNLTLRNPNPRAGATDVAPMTSEAASA